MNQFLDKVTITGADDTIDPKELFALRDKFPFVEFGILFSKDNKRNIRSIENFNGSPRFPSKKWLAELYQLAINAHLNRNPIRLSAHLCGGYVVDATKGFWSFFDKVKENAMFDRIQLNFHGIPHKIDRYNYLAGLNDARLAYRQVIFQLDNVNDELLELARSKINCVGLFDLSHGAGVLPAEWPTSTVYSGYAGGLSPDNIESQLETISSLAPAGWVDFETHARNDNDKFDIGKCTEFLEKCRPYTIYADKIESLQESELINVES